MTPNTPRDLDQHERDALVAAAMAFAPATDIPRERVVMRSAITSLVADFPDAEFTKLDAIASICRHGELVELRDEFAREVFQKLVDQKALLATDEVSATYRVSDTVRAELRRTSDELENLFEKIVTRLFGALSPGHRGEIKTSLLKCLAQLMSDYGREYAYQVSGRTEETFSPRRDYLLRICRGVLTKQVDAEKMADAIAQLFNDDAPVFARFAFFLTQNYYFLNLLGLAGGLAYFSQERFRGAEMFVDTNLVFGFLVPESRHRRSIVELTDLARRLEISFHVTEATLEEFKAVVAHHQLLVRTYDEVPEDLVANIKQQVLFHAYRARKHSNPQLTADEFLVAFDDPRHSLSQEWNIEVLDKHFETDEDKKFLARAKHEIQLASRFYRRKEKSERALEHDAHLLQLVRSERLDFGDRAAWVLTLDSSLVPAAKELREQTEQPWCMTLDGFLQILSPYVRADRQQDFAENFLRVVGRNLFAPDDVLELEDFRMFTDMDLSVRRLPGADVRKVIRNVRDAVGDDLSSADRRNVAYAVQKALSDPTLTYRQKHEVEVAGLKEEIAKTEARRLQTEEEAIKLATSTEGALMAAQRENAALRAEAAAKTALLEHQLHVTKQGLAAKELEVDTHAADTAGKDKHHASELARHRRHFWLLVCSVMAMVVVAAAWLVPDPWIDAVHPTWVIRIGVTTATAMMVLGQFLGWTLNVRLALAVATGSLVGGLGKLTAPSPSAAASPGSGSSPSRPTGSADGGIGSKLRAP